MNERNPRQRGPLSENSHGSSLRMDGGPGLHNPELAGDRTSDAAVRQMTKILFASYSGLFGGAERVLLDCAAAVDGQHLLACPEGGLAEHARAVKLAVLPQPERRLNVRADVRDRLLAPARVAAHARELRALARDLDPDLVVAWGMRSAIASLALPRSRPFAFAHNDFLPGSWIAAAVRAAATRAAVVIVPSYAVARDLDQSGRLAGRLRVVPPGVDPHRFADIGPPPERPEVLVVGAIAGWKRPDLALEICAIARRELPELAVRFVGAPVSTGDGTLAALRVRAHAPDLAGAVALAGPSADVRAELERAACLLHCAPREPFGIVLLEALAAGRPVVAPDAAGPREIVDRSCGLLYRAGDARSGAAALVELLSDRPRMIAMGTAGRERVRTGFGTARTRSGFARALEPLLGRERPECPEPERLALVTVTHNSAPELDTLIDSVQRHLPGASLTVVDCDSVDDSLAVAARRSWVRTIGLEQNLGFGRACNVGVSDVKTAVTALVNPDVVLIDDSLLRLAAEALRTDRPERLLAPLVLNVDGTRQETAHPVPSSVSDLIRAVLPPSLLPGSSGVPLAPWRAGSPRRVGWAVGAVLVARTATLRRLGPFDESIFMYGEDLELGLRAASEGVETWFWPAGRVLHGGAHATGRAFGGEPFDRLAQARHDVVAHRLGPRRARLDDSAQAVTFASRLALKRALGRPGDRESRQLAAVRSMRRRAP
jgi:N-acetylglucosaminyl-diphospho-decaprenol L-rhamnosyltransferase